MFAAVAMTAAMAVASAKSPRPDPLDPKAATPALRFETGLESPKRAAEADPASTWREHNERVRVMGGHAGYLRGASPEPDAKPARDTVGKQ